MKTPVLDASQSAFFQRELELIEQRLYEVKFPGLEAEMLLSNRVQVPAGVTKYTFRLFDKRGDAVPFAGSEDGAPMVDIDGEEQSANLMSYVDAYGWNVEEIAAAAHAGMPLMDMKARLARQKIAEALNKLALMGNSAHGIEGLFSLSNTQSFVIAGGAWSTKTVDAILTDMFGIVDTIPNNTFSIENPMVMVLPKSVLRFISTKRNSATDRSVTELFAMARPDVRLVGANYLDTAGAGSTTRAVAYDPSQVQWLVSFPFEALPVEQQGFKFVVNCRGRAGGVITPYPKSVLYADGV